MNVAGTRALIVVFDALRPEFMSPNLMPNLCSFAARGTRYTHGHSVFPTETRVNQTALITGCLPRTTGIVANTFLARDVDENRVARTAEYAELASLFATSRRPLIGAPTLGQRLAKAGRCYASLSSGTAGGGLLINHSADTDGSFRLSMRAPDATVPASAWAELAKTIGPLPDVSHPAKAWITWAVEAYLNWIEPNITPDLMLLWLCEPDETFHYRGIGSPEARETIRHLDAEFGRIIDHHSTALDAGNMQIVAQSDHGQITLEGQPLGMVEHLNRAGFRAANQPGPDVDAVVAVHNAGGIWVRDDDPALTGDIVAHLQEADWCGPVFTNDGIGGTLTLDRIGLDHLRAPTIAMACAAQPNRPNDFGIAGSTRHDAPYPVGGGCHGGLSEPELQTVLTLCGSAFRKDCVLDLPAGNCDVAPTLCHLLGVPFDAPCDGRVLHETLVDAKSAEHGQPDREIEVSRNTAGKKTKLATTRYAGCTYLLSASAS
ncbi:MAG: alkaline phosphatase family protein [Pseudomonadota bacterium]